MSDCCYSYHLLVISNSTQVVFVYNTVSVILIWGFWGCNLIGKAFHVFAPWQVHAHAVTHYIRGHMILCTSLNMHHKYMHTYKYVLFTHYTHLHSNAQIPQHAHTYTQHCTHTRTHTHTTHTQHYTHNTTHTYTHNTTHTYTHNTTHTTLHIPTHTTLHTQHYTYLHTQHYTHLHTHCHTPLFICTPLKWHSQSTHRWTIIINKGVMLWSSWHYCLGNCKTTYIHVSSFYAFLNWSGILSEMQNVRFHGWLSVLLAFMVTWSASNIARNC